MRIPLISLVAAGALALGGCGYNGLGVGVGYGSPYAGYGSYGGYGYDPYYDGYGYGSRYGGYGYGSRYGSYGYGSRYGGFGYGGYGGYGGFGYQPYGWYDGFYYPGTGYYVYDNQRRARIWSDAQRAYWLNKIRNRPTTGTSTGTSAPTVTTTRVATSPNWSGFDDRRARSADRVLRQDRMQGNRAERRERLEQRQIERQPGMTTTTRRETRRSRRGDN
jgi:hypothetical protein